MNPEVWGFIGAILGASTSILTTFINNKNSNRIQSNLELNRRRELFREFQRDNLLKIQEKISKNMRLIGKAHIEDLSYFKETNKWNHADLSTELDNSLADSFRELSFMIERVDNNELREKLKKLIEQMAKCLFSQNLTESKEEIKKMTFELDNLMEDLGVVLRSYY
ncbi:hypothetical protein [Tenacibaculum sp. IB213877]|uniref:hypothetical protein n=1 Tax=Tenacibaculum sp. IB213877 TaxID=3097351 RepID=UPI002A5A731D|nr:hypothetical protein [Tenacibaculum sp. IB213877]MDY0780393.1 hypothetical protein [Tenacibaculum sp. IB213877]